MLVLRRFCEVLFTIVIVSFFSAANGISFENQEKNLTDKEKRGTLQNEILPNDGQISPSAKTEKRGIWEIGSNDDRYGNRYDDRYGNRYDDRYGDGPPRPPYHGGYEPSGYGGSGDRYPHTGIDNIGPSGPDYYRPGGHRPSGDGYSYYGEGSYRPSGHGSGYGPPEPPYEEGYGGEPHYHDQGGGLSGHGIGGYKAAALKKILLPALAGLAILGVATVASQNPVLLQLGVLKGRRKRSVQPPEIYPSNPKVRPNIHY